MDREFGDWLLGRVGAKQMSKKWFVVHAYSGYEKNVARALQERVELSNFGE